jgi:hypothetical protein
MKTLIVAAAFSAVLACGLSVMAEDSVPKGWSIQGTKPAAYEIKPDPAQKSVHGNSISIQSRGETDGMATLCKSSRRTISEENACVFPGTSRART